MLNIQKAIYFIYNKSSKIYFFISNNFLRKTVIIIDLLDNKLS